MITVNLLRISPDSQYLEFSVECPEGYVFNTLYIKRYNPNDVETTIDASNLYESNPTATKHVMRIAISALGGTGMFQVEFGVAVVVTDPVSGLPELDNVISICSDVNSVYTYLLDNILNMNVDCLKQSNYELLTQNYMFLYAHLEAMRLERFEEAKMFYDILYNNFTNCTVDNRNDPRIINNCNCK